MQHRAIREAIAAGSAAGARTLAREHVLASGHMQEVILEHMGAHLRERETGRRRTA